MSHSFFSWFQLSLAMFGVLGLFLVFIALMLLISLRKKKLGQGIKIEIKKINETYKENKDKILKEILNATELKDYLKNEKITAKEKNNLEKKAKEKNQEIEKRKKVFVLDFNGDVAASAVSSFREQITALLQTAEAKDEVVIRLESPGGMVHAYGLAASQIARIKEKNIPLTICVDKVAASGGYMMACLANKIIAAPFAILGSIGVIASLPNINKLLHKNNIEYLEMTAGEYKRTLTPFGEITEKKKVKFQEQIEEVHELFKEHVQRYRNSVDISKVATGEYWFGIRAIELNLVDELKTSDDYLLNLSKDFDIYHIFTPKKESFKDKLTNSAQAIINSVILKNIQKEESQYPLLM